MHSPVNHGFDVFMLRIYDFFVFFDVFFNIQMSNQTNYHWGIDLGGTKIEGIILEGDKTTTRMRIPSEADMGYEHLCGNIVKLVEKLKRLGSEVLVGGRVPSNLDGIFDLFQRCES